MGLFDWLSGSDEAEQAAAKNAALYQQYGVNTGNLYNQYKSDAVGALGDARTAGLGALQTGLSQQVGAYGQGIDALKGVSTDPLQQAIAAQKTGNQGALAAGRAGVDAFNPLSQLGESYQPAIDTYYSSLGIGDPSKAQNAFTASPGYQYQVDQATKQALAGASRSGLAGSGNFAQGLSEDIRNRALSDYGNWQNRLQGFVPLQQQAVSGAATGVAGANRTLADIYNTGGTNVAGAYGNLFAGQRGLGQDIAGAYGQIGGAYGTSGTQQAGLQTGYGQDVTNVLGNYTAGQGQTLKDITAGNAASNAAIAQAGQTDASNLWGLLGAGVKAAGAGFGGGLGK
jgi:hypothetical protein